MDHKVIKIFIPLFLIAACFFSGCGENPEEEDQPAIQVKKSFIKIQDHGMELKIISTLASYRLADTRATMKFQFINEGLAQVKIPEWQVVERDNIKVQYAECPEEGGAEKLPESAWKDAPRKVVEGDCPRYPLELDPKSSVILTMPLSFIKELKKPGRYAVRGVMDLTSMDVKSTPLELIIR